jgi:hypothetical protein
MTIKKYAAALKTLLYEMPQWATGISNLTVPYLCNGIDSNPVVTAGGTGYVATSFTVPLPYTAPANSVPAVITCTLSGAGVLSAPVVTVHGSGYGCGVITFTPTDGSGSGASITISPANPDQQYNYTPTVAGFLQWYLGLDFAQLANVLQGNVGANTVTAIGIHSGAAGSAYVVGDTVFPTQAGLTGCRISVASVVGGGPGPGVPASLTINIGGIGAAVASNLPTTGGSGTGLYVDISTVAPYNFVTNTINWTVWGF